MIVAGLFAIFALLTMPAFERSRNMTYKNACINNLRQISGAKDLYSLDRLGRIPTTVSHLVPDYVSKLPRCAAKGTYNLRALGQDPTCSLGSTRQHTM